MENQQNTARGTYEQYRELKWEFFRTRCAYGPFGKFRNKSYLYEEDKARLEEMKTTLSGLAQRLETEKGSMIPHTRGKIYDLKFKIEKYLKRKTSKPEN